MHALAVGYARSAGQGVRNSVTVHFNSVTVHLIAAVQLPVPVKAPFASAFLRN